MAKKRKRKSKKDSKKPDDTSEIIEIPFPEQMPSEPSDKKEPPQVEDFSHTGESREQIQYDMEKRRRKATGKKRKRTTKILPSIKDPVQSLSEEQAQILSGDIPFEEKRTEDIDLNQIGQTGPLDVRVIEQDQSELGGLYPQDKDADKYIELQQKQPVEQEKPKSDFGILHLAYLCPDFTEEQSNAPPILERVLKYCSEVKSIDVTHWFFNGLSIEESLKAQQEFRELITLIGSKIYDYPGFANNHWVIPGPHDSKFEGPVFGTNPIEDLGEKVNEYYKRILGNPYILSQNKEQVDINYSWFEQGQTIVKKSYRKGSIVVSPYHLNLAELGFEDCIGLFSDSEQGIGKYSLKPWFDENGNLIIAGDFVGYPQRSNEAYDINLFPGLFTLMNFSLSAKGFSSMEVKKFQLSSNFEKDIELRGHYRIQKQYEDKKIVKRDIEEIKLSKAKSKIYMDVERTRESGEIAVSELIEIIERTSSKSDATIVSAEKAIISAINETKLRGNSMEQMTKAYSEREAELEKTTSERDSYQGEHNKLSLELKEEKKRAKKREETLEKRFKRDKEKALENLRLEKDGVILDKVTSFSKQKTRLAQTYRNDLESTKKELGKTISRRTWWAGITTAATISLACVAGFFYDHNSDKLKEITRLKNLPAVVKAEEYKDNLAQKENKIIFLEGVLSDLDNNYAQRGEELNQIKEELTQRDKEIALLEQAVQEGSSDELISIMKKELNLSKAEILKLKDKNTSLKQEYLTERDKSWKLEIEIARLTGQTPQPVPTPQPQPIPTTTQYSQVQLTEKYAMTKADADNLNIPGPSNYQYLLICENYAFYFNEPGKPPVQISAPTQLNQPTEFYELNISVKPEEVVKDKNLFQRIKELENK